MREEWRCRAVGDEAVKVEHWKEGVETRDMLRPAVTPNQFEPEGPQGSNQRRREGMAMARCKDVSLKN